MQGFKFALGVAVALALIAALLFVVPVLTVLLVNVWMG